MFPGITSLAWRAEPYCHSTLYPREDGYSGHTIVERDDPSHLANRLEQITNPGCIFQDFQLAIGTH